jgi:hypothetical protein
VSIVTGWVWRALKNSVTIATLPFSVMAEVVAVDVAIDLATAFGRREGSAKPNQIFFVNSRYTRRGDYSLYLLRCLRDELGLLVPGAAGAFFILAPPCAARCSLNYARGFDPFFFPL